LKQSTVFLAQLQATAKAQSTEECIVSVTVSEETSSGEHKFKVTGMMVSEFTDGRPEFEGGGEDQAWGGLENQIERARATP
jgi:hypothetical protein